MATSFRGRVFDSSAAFDLGGLLDALRPRPAPEFRVHVRRPDDLLVFDLVLENLALKTGQAPRLERREPARTALLIVEFPPQCFGEEAFLEHSTADGDDDKRAKEKPPSPYPPKNVPSVTEALPPLPAARVRMAGPSRLVFAMPPGTQSLAYTLGDVLQAMRTWPLHLDFSAQPDPDPPPDLLVRVGNLGASRVAVLSNAWQDTALQLASALEQGVGGDAVAAVAAAGERVAANAAGATAGSAQAVMGELLLRSIHGEVDGLRHQFPALGRGPAHRATIATLSLAAAEGAASAAPDKSSVDLVSELPYFRLIMAPHEPRRDTTALELPYRLLLSPTGAARWAHRPGAPRVNQGRTELWHTRLTLAAAGTGPDNGPDLPTKVRAIWSPDYRAGDQRDIIDYAAQAKPYRMSLDPLDREMLVKNMAGYDEVRPNRTPFTPRASRASRLHLSSLGALLDVEGSWSPRPAGVDLEQWRHLAALGRDAYVRVVYAGFLYCLGHAASLVKVTERKFEGPAGGRVAALRQRFFLVVRERVKDYRPAEHFFEGRNFPFTRVEILTRVTPSLATPGKGPSAVAAPAIGIAPRMAFWPMVEGKSTTPQGDFGFEIVATDIHDQQLTFALPLVFVSEVVNADPTLLKVVKDAYNADKTAETRRRADTGGASLCFATPDPSQQGDTRLPTMSMVLAGGDLRSGLHHTDPPAPNFYPELARAEVGIKAVQKLLGRPHAVAEVVYPEVYKAHGFGELDATQNRGRLFLQLHGQAHRLEFGNDSGQAKSDALGALASPAMSILGLSRAMGPVGGQEPANLSDPAQVEKALADAVNNRFEPSKFFAGAKILGGVDLASILDAVTDLADPAVPKLVSREVHNPDRVEASFDWMTEITRPDPANLIVPQADGTNPTTLQMSGTVTTLLGSTVDTPAKSTYEATASLTNFKVNLFGFIILWFDTLSFDAHQGRKPDVGVSLNGKEAVRFGGPLEFVNQLRDLIPANGFSDPPALTVTPSGITAGFSLTLPAVGVGVFALSNASLGASFSLPFDARPAAVRFNFSERQSPFSLTVSALGGGGFFAIGISAQGVQEIEAALEFGAAVAIDLGVASGSVEIKGGIYFHWLEPTPGKGSVELAGYVRLHGELTVIGMISASLTFNLQLAYKKEGGKSTVWGEATLTVEIEVLFFSASVKVKCRREFGGSDSDPKFIDLVPDESTWADYCQAFAPERP